MIHDISLLWCPILAVHNCIGSFHETTWEERQKMLAIRSFLFFESPVQESYSSACSSIHQAYVSTYLIKHRS